MASVERRNRGGTGCVRRPELEGARTRRVAEGSAASRSPARAEWLRARRRHVVIPSCARGRCARAVREIARRGNPRSTVRFRPDPAALRAAARPRSMAQARRRARQASMSESERDLRHAQEMKIMQEERRAERATKKLRGGLLIVLTGSGKGKS